MSKFEHASSGRTRTSPRTYVSKRLARDGAFEIIIISDGYFVLPPPNVAVDVGFLYPDTPRSELEAFLNSVG